MSKFERLVVGGVGFLGWVLVGCSGASPSHSDGVEPISEEEGALVPQASNSDVPNDPDAQGASNPQLLASLSLSPTHTVAFLRDRSSQTTYVHEKLHADLDGPEATIASRGAQTGMSLEELYVIAAGSDVDWAVVDMLASADRATEVGSTEFEAGAANEQTAGAPIQDPAAQSAPTAAATSEGEFAQVALSLCTEPNWNWVNWNADSDWFEYYFSNPDYDYFRASVSSHDKHLDGKYLGASLFNQSHCLRALAIIDHAEKKPSCWNPFTVCPRVFYVPVHLTVEPRYVSSIFWTGKKDDAWWIEFSNDGSKTGMVMNAYN